MNIITGLFQLVSSTVINSNIVNSEIETEFSKRKMELNALVEKCLNWREEFDKDFKVCFCQNKKYSRIYETWIPELQDLKIV